MVADDRGPLLLSIVSYVAVDDLVLLQMSIIINVAADDLVPLSLNIFFGKVAVDDLVSVAVKSNTACIWKEI